MLIMGACVNVIKGDKTMKKLLKITVLFLFIVLLLSGCSKTTVLEVVYVDDYYRVLYEDVYYVGWIKNNNITSRRFYTVYGVNNFMRNSVDVNLSEWPDGRIE